MEGGGQGAVFQEASPALRQGEFRRPSGVGPE